MKRNIPGLWGGISRQPASQRSPNQCEDMVNMVPDVVLGAVQRPGTYVAAYGSNTPNPNQPIQSVRAYDQTWFIQTNGTGGLNLWDESWNPQTISYPSMGVATDPDPYGRPTVYEHPSDPGVLLFHTITDPAVLSWSGLPLNIPNARGTIKPGQSIYFTAGSGAGKGATRRYVVPTNKEITLQVYSVVLPESQVGYAIGISIGTGAHQVPDPSTSSWVNLVIYRSYLQPLLTGLGGYSTEFSFRGMDSQILAISHWERPAMLFRPRPWNETYKNWGVIKVTQGLPTTTYTVILNDTINGETKLEYTTTATAADYDVSNIAYQLSLDLPLTDYHVVRNGGTVLFVAKNNGLDVLLVQSMTDPLVSAASWNPEGFADLPAQAYPGMIAKVGNEGASYWVRYFEGAWVECPDPELCNEFDPTTMPHRLRWTGGTSWIFEPILTDSADPDSWSGRVAGGLDSAPEPSFIGRVIKAVEIHKSRLFVASGSDLAASRPSDLFNFWPTSAKEAIASDPMDFSCRSGSSSDITSIQSVQDSLLIMTADRQYRLAGVDGVLSPTTINLDSISDLRFNTNTQPVSLGQTMILVVPRSSDSQVLEYTIKGAEAGYTDLSSHVQGLLPPDIDTVLAYPEYGLVFFHSSTTSPETVFVYRFTNNGSERVQSAWTRYRFRNPIRRIWKSSTRLWMLGDIQAVYGLTVDLPATNQAMIEYLDERFTYSTVVDYPYEAVPQIHAYDYTSVLWPASPPLSLWGYQELSGIPYMDPILSNGTSGVLAPNHGSVPDSLVAGVFPEALIDLGPWYPTDHAGMSDIGGRVQLEAVQVEILNTFAMRITVFSDGRNPRHVDHYNNRVALDNDSTYNFDSRLVRTSVLTNALRTNIRISNIQPGHFRIGAITLRGKTYGNSRFIGNRQ